MAVAATIEAPERERRFRHQDDEYEGIYVPAELSDDDIADEAWQLIDQRERVSKADTPEREYRDNARTALMEALTASGHLSVVEIEGTLEEINTQILRRLLNGWDESLPHYELSRRFAEICNELFIQKTHRAIVKGSLPPDTEVLEVSDHPEPLLGAQLGYRDANRKGMVRSTGLRNNGNGQYTRVIEQVSRSNSHDGSTRSFFASCGVPLRQDIPVDLAALERPTIYTRRDYVDGVVDVQRSLDWHASQRAGEYVLYGDTGERIDRHPAYENLRYESVGREKQIEFYTGKLAAAGRNADGRHNHATGSHKDVRRGSYSRT
jgi:hypothetical protein